MSGFALFTVSYLWSPSTYLIDRNLIDWSPAAAIAAALGFLVAFWLIYDRICQWFGFRKNGDAIVGALVFVTICVAAWLACQLFPGRAAFLLMGAMIATAMSANVFFWIIPGQRTVVAAMTTGQNTNPADLAIHGKRGKQRSVHNTYFTLPVLFAMLSNHYSFTYSHSHNWLVLIVMMLAGALIRQFFVMRHGWRHGRNGHPWPYAAVGCAFILVTIVALMPERREAPASAAAQPAPTYAALAPVLAQRCLLCHGEQVQMKNVRLDTPEQLGRHAQAVYQQVVVARTMPMNNSTGLTEDERALIGRWFQAGAPLK